MDARTCPECKVERVAVHSIIGPSFNRELPNEIRWSAHCPACGHSWTTIYSPTEQIERN